MSDAFPKKIIAFRHGRFPLNERASLRSVEALDAVAQGVPHDADSVMDLLPQGYHQALTLNGILKSVRKIDACLSSPTRRARMTAELALRGLVRLEDIQSEPQLIERSRGVFSYAPDEWARQQLVYRVNKRSTLDWKPFGMDYNGNSGESIRQVMDSRVSAVLSRAGEQAPGGTVALSTHGEWMLALRAKLLGFDDDRLRQPLISDLPSEAIASRDARWIAHAQVDFYEFTETDNGIQTAYFRTAVGEFDTGCLPIDALQ